MQIEYAIPDGVYDKRCRLFIFQRGGAWCTAGAWSLPWYSSRTEVSWYCLENFSLAGKGKSGWVIHADTVWCSKSLSMTNIRSGRCCKYLCYGSKQYHSILCIFLLHHCKGCGGGGGWLSQKQGGNSITAFYVFECEAASTKIGPSNSEAVHSEIHTSIGVEFPEQEDKIEYKCAAVTKNAVE